MIKDRIVSCLKSNWMNSVLASNSNLIQNRVAQTSYQIITQVCNIMMITLKMAGNPWTIRWQDWLKWLEEMKFSFESKYRFFSQNINLWWINYQQYFECRFKPISANLRMLPTVFEEKAENYFKSMYLRNKTFNRHRNLHEATLMCVLEARHIKFWKVN